MQYRATKTPYIPPEGRFDGEHLEATGVKYGITGEAGVLKISEILLKISRRYGGFGAFCPMQYRDTKTPYIPPKSTFGGEHLEATGVQCGITCEAGVLKISAIRMKISRKMGCFGAF